MPKPKTAFVCRSCGAQQPRWVGRCPECGGWDSLEEEVEAAAPSGRMLALAPSRPIPLPAVSTEDHPRRPTGIRELDRVLGGGIVPGSVTLLGGDPGIGKSTLILQLCAGLAAAGGRSLYVTGEESVAQTRMRADRLGIASPEILLLTENSLPAILGHLRETRPHFAAVDSIQMVFKPEIPSAPGSVSQVRECAAELVTQAKSSGTPIFLVGHVTKDGAIAGPRVLEHLVDTVLYFEGQKHQTHRILRCIKNRFGPASELALFEMTDRGLAEVENPSAFFMAQRPHSGPGSAIVPSLEGTRPLLVEVQALVATAGYGIPQRRVSGADPHRVAMILAVLERRAGLVLSNQDVFVNVVGGVTVEEPGADLGIALAIAGSLLSRRVPPGVVVSGEIGLQGEVRPVHQMEARLREGYRIGLAWAWAPLGAHKVRPKELGGLEIREFANVSEVLGELVL